MVKEIVIALVATALASGPVVAGSIKEEHERAKAGGYEKEYEKSMKKYEGTRTRTEHERYHREESQKSNKSDREEDYGRAYQEKQLGTQGKIRTW